MQGFARICSDRSARRPVLTVSVPDGAVIRAAAYLIASGVVWVIEGFLFSRLLVFSASQVALTIAIYLGLFVAAALLLIRFVRRFRDDTGDLPRWRLLSLAPMLVAIVGSFVSLPLLLLVVALGKVV